MGERPLLLAARQRSTKAATAPPLDRSTAAEEFVSATYRSITRRVAARRAAPALRWSLRENQEVTKPVSQMKRGMRRMQNERGDTYFQFQPAFMPPSIFCGVDVVTSLLPSGKIIEGLLRSIYHHSTLKTKHKNLLTLMIGVFLEWRVP